MARMDCYKAITEKIKGFAKEHDKYMQACSANENGGGVLLVGLYIPQYKRYRTFVLRSDMSDEALKVSYSDVVGRMEVLKSEWEWEEKARKSLQMCN